jgi:acylphosphatase
MTVIRHVVFSGRVQGVGFRAHVEDAAARTVVGGWVRNRRDGTVEAIFAGDAKAVGDTIAACRKGSMPPASTVWKCAMAAKTSWRRVATTRSPCCQRSDASFRCNSATPAAA